MRLGPHNIAVVTRPPATEDTFGNPTYNWGAATSTAVAGCSVQPLIGQEAIVGRDTVVSRWQVWAPSGTTISAVDRVVFAGDTYEVDGEVQAWLFPPRVHVTFLMQRSESS
jgi:hypothetical protein